MGKRITKLIKYLFLCLIELLYPKRTKCISCNKEIDDELQICENCLKNLTKIHGPCKLPKDNEIGGEVLLYSVFYYSGIVKELIKKFKYFKDFESGETIARLLKDHIEKEKIYFDIMTNVPTSKVSFKARGVDQCEVLCRMISRELDKPYKNLLYRKIEVKEQKRLTVDERKSNMKDVFEIRDKYSIRGKIILLIDDVITTGATVMECKQKLIENGAKSVIILTLCKSYI